MNLSTIVWLTADGRKPTDGKELPPRCLLEGLATLLDVTCDLAFVAVNVIGFGLLGIVLIIAFLVVKRRLVVLYCSLHATVSAVEWYDVKRSQVRPKKMSSGLYRGGLENHKLCATAAGLKLSTVDNRNSNMKDSLAYELW